MMPQEKQTGEIQHLDEAETKDHNSQIIETETLLSAKLNLAQVDTKLEDVSPVLPDSQESES